MTRHIIDASVAIKIHVNDCQKPNRPGISKFVIKK